MDFAEWTRQNVMKEQAAPIGTASASASGKNGVPSFAEWTAEQDHAARIAEADHEISMLKVVKKESDDLRRKVSTLATSESGYITERQAEIYRQYGSPSDIEAKIEELQESKWEHENAIKYGSLSDRPDFAEKSGYVSTATDNAFKKAFSQYSMGYDDLTYEYINGSDDLRNAILNKAISFHPDNSLDATSDWKRLDHMTDPEKRSYTYLYNTEGKKEADAYLDYLKHYLDERVLEQTKENAAAVAEKHPVISSIGSVPMNLMSGAGVLDVVWQNLEKNIKEAVTGEYAGPINYNSGAMTGSAISSTVRGTVAKKIADKTGVISLDEKKHPVLSQILNGKSLGDVYQLGMSMADSAAVAALSPVLGSAGTALLGGSSATQTMLDAVANGASDEQALTMGLLSGGFEMLFEKYELESLLGSDTHVLRSMAKQALSEGAGESATSIANTLADVIVMTDKSNWQAGIDAYMQAGLSEEDAMKQAFLDIAIQIGWDFAGGALSGGIMGGGTSAIQKFDANTQAGKAVVANPGGVAALKQAATSTAMELDGSAQKSLNRLAGKVSTEQQTGKGLGSIVTKVRNAINTQRVGSLYNRTSDAITGLNATDFATRLERGGFTKQKASAVAKATIEAAAGYAVDGRAQALLESVWQDTAYQKALTETVKDDQSVISQRRDRIGQVLQERDTQVEKQENPSTFQEEVQRQFEEDNGYRQSVQKTYDIDEVFTAAQDARNSGAISEDRYNELLNNMQYAQSDYGEGNISEEQYYGTLETVMQQIGRYDAGKGDSAYSASATDPLVDVDRDTWQQAQRLAQALGRNIVFYNGARGENGYFKDGTIYVNILASDPFAQVFSHELTHSLDGTKHYEGLKRFVFSRLARSNIDIAQARKAKADQYQRHGKVLKGETEIDAEIVAEYVQTHLLTDEQSIMELVAAEPNVAKRIWKWATNLLRRMVGSQASRDRAELEHMERIYAKALRESRGDDAGAGTVSLRSQFASGEQTQVDDLVLARERTQWDYQEGRISDEEYDAAMDEYDRAQEERLSGSVEKYSISQQSAVNPTARYDYTKPFADQLADYQNGTFPADDALVIGGTPEVLKSIGLIGLPMTINQKHVKDALNGTYKGSQQEKLDHTFTIQELSKLPDRIADPIAVIHDKRTGKANASESVIDVLVEMTAASGKQVLAAVQIMGNGRINGTRIDTNKVATVHGNTDSIARLIDAINENQKGNVAVFYINKDKTTKALQRTGNPIPSGLSNLDGFIKSISDSGSPVKRRISSVAESQQFKRWFGDWEMHPQNASKVVNADGTPKIVYHGTNAEFDVFQSEDGNYWFSESDDYAEAMMIERNGSRIIPAYLNMRNPYIASLPADQFTNPAYENPIIQKAKSGGYDGVIIENETDNDLAYDKFYVVFSPAQIKSASDNIGTFDGDNPSIRYSFSDTQVADQGHRPANGWYDTDEVEMQARKKGYPVLHGEQVVPFNTWVKTRDRGNYGLVTGIAPGNKLLVSFHNKHDGGTADNVAIAYDNLIPVPGEHQMTKEEFASLMESEPLDPNDQELSEEDMRAMEELYRRSGGEDAEGGKKVEPIDMESLPRRAQQYLKRTQSTLLRDLAKRLGVSKFVDRSFLQETVNEICMEYLNTGTVSDEKLGELFDKTYKQGIIIDRTFYDQNKEILDKLRSTAVTISEQDQSNIADYKDFRKRQALRLRIVDKGGLPIDTFYDELRSMASSLFPENITHPADQLLRMAEVSRSIAISKQTLDEYYGPEARTFHSFAKNEFDTAVGEIMGDLHTLRRFAEERAAAAARAKRPATVEEAEEAYGKLKKARRKYERVSSKHLLSQHDEILVGRLLRHEMELSHLNPETDNVKGITAVYEAKAEYEELSKLISEYKRHLHGEMRKEADRFLKTAGNWKDKGAGILYSRETMRRNIYDIVKDRALAREINEAYFEPVHDAEAKAVRLKDKYRNRVREMNLSLKVQKGNLVSEAHAVQLLGEAEDNIRILENTRGRMEHRDGKTLAEWRAVVAKLWDENPNLDQAKIRGAVQQFRQIYDDLFSLMNRVRVENGYEPINYRSGYFPHFQPGASDGILAQFGRALGIDTQVVALPTTINGLTHTFKPGIQWFGNAQERLGFNTAYDAVEGFDKYIEGAASVIFQTGNVQRLRAFATQVRYRTSEKGIQEQVDAVYEDNRLTDEEKQIKIANIYEHGKYELGNFVAELDEYTNLLANKKSKYDRTVEALMGRKSYVFLKWLESRVGANMIAGNISSALTNFIPLTQAGAQIDKSALMKGMLQTLVSLKNDDGLLGASTFLTNRRGSDPLVRTWVEKASVTAGFLMDAVDQFVSGSVVRGAYYHNLKRGLSEAEAMHQADIFAAGVMADRSKGSMPTLMQASNPVFKLFTQFQLEVNNQFSEVFKDLPRNHREKGVGALALVFLQYFLGAWLFNNLFEELFGRRPALDPIGIVLDAGKDFSDPDVGFGEGIKNLGSDVLEELPFSSGLNLLGFELDGGRFPVESAIPDLTAIGEAITAKPYDPETKTGWSGEKRWKEISDELSKPLAYIIPPFGGNQVSKTVKGIGAFIQGGSYSVDAAGEDILQYPVYKDDPWAALGSLFRASILGKSSLPEAQEWVEGGFDSLNAKETAVYKEMLEVGVTDRDAYALLQELGAAKKTEDLSKKAVQRQILMDSGTSDEGKTIAYYGLLATRPDDDSDTMSEQEIMDALTDLGANPWEAAKTLIKIADANALESEAERTAKCDAIIEAALTDDEKSVIVGRYILDSDEMLTEKGNLTEWAKYMAAVEGGLGVNEYLKFRKTGGDIDDYLGFSYAGLKPDDAIDAAQAMDDLVPLNGKKQVSDIQRWRACVDTFTNEATQMAALAAKMDDTQYAKLDLAYGYGISPDTYVTLREDLPKYDADGSGSITKKEVQKAVSAVRGLSSTQRAVLWQIVTGSKSAKGNPFNINAGQGVLDALEKLKENSDVGLTFQEEIIRQWNLKG